MIYGKQCNSSASVHSPVHDWSHCRSGSRIGRIWGQRWPRARTPAVASRPAGARTRRERVTAMRVRVVPVAELKRQLLPKGGSVLWLDLPDGTTIAEVLQQLDVKVQDRLIVGLDGAYAPLDTPLHENAELTLVT